MISKDELRKLGWSDELIDSVIEVARLVAHGAIPKTEGGNIVEMPTQVSDATRIDLSYSVPTNANRLIIPPRVRRIDMR